MFLLASREVIKCKDIDMFLPRPNKDVSGYNIGASLQTAFMFERNRKVTITGSKQRNLLALILPLMFHYP